ncbi:MAG: hypothetical protein V4671_07115 [Armatimonadota bacterium]
MRRQRVPAYFRSDVGHAPHRFPSGTLLVSVSLLVGGMRLADVLPMPSLPRFLAGKPVTAAVWERKGTANASGAAGSANGLTAQISEPDLSVQDISYGATRAPLWPGVSVLETVADDGRITVVDPRSRAKIWDGPIRDAHFEYTYISARQTLKDSAGRVIWSDAPKLDLVFDRQIDGNSRLTDNTGRVLWSGMLAPAPMPSAPRASRRGTTYTMNFSGVRISGVNGYCTVVNDSGENPEVLWSGTLPPRPLLLMRASHRFLFCGRVPSALGRQDQSLTIRFSREPGSVTIRDTQSQVLGKRSLDLLKMDTRIKNREGGGQVILPPQYQIPYGRLHRSGSVLVTYHDRAGQVVQKGSLVRDGSHFRANSTAALW